ncbi:hypothetical protein DWT03_07780 [Staphylococcus pseudintermedius]|nr:hypothetical protein [Staphylococcus pseudintermedius]EGQ1765089.1 hypothetical protein [Staphylococcus pseudintermedius]EGQ1783654.1 hypothetical protein [Staphylococcus pseudintermedius]EGQ4314296.1 hypothetical protein [Staphylococcus pseudintermedius]EGQ4406025.1 hypothetical protein [Staphylococcus pseudintermedius]
MKKISTNIFILILMLVLIFNLLDNRIIQNSQLSQFINISFLILAIVFVIGYIFSKNNKKK